MRPEPLPHSSESAGKYLSQPKQMRSGCLGCRGNFYFFFCTALKRVETPVIIGIFSE